MKTAEQILVDLTESVNKERSAVVDENIHAVGEAIKRARDKGFGSLRTPILAGGAIRDYVYGLTPQDYDVFLDVTGIPEDEQEDAVLLFGLRVIDELTAADDSKFKALEDNTLRKLGAEYGMEGRVKNGQGFYVFETGPFDERIQRIWNEDVAIDADRANDQFRFIKLQFIGHSDTRLSKEDPTEFVEAFDYELVKGLFDPEIMAYRLHDDFVKVVNSKTLTVREERTARRVYDWSSRFSWANIGQRLNCPIKIVNEAPAKKSMFEIKTGSLPSGRGLLYQAAADQRLMNNAARELLRNMAPPAPDLNVRQWNALDFLAMNEPRRVRILNEQEAVQGWEAVRDIPEMPPAVPIIDLEPDEAEMVNELGRELADDIDNRAMQDVANAWGDAEDGAGW